MSASKSKLTDVNDEELKQMLLSKANAPALSHEGMDHLAAYNDIPQPTKEDLASAEAAQQWAQNELVKANPRAAQEFINQLRRGNSKERMEAAKEIFNRTGLHSGQTKVTNNATVVVLTADAVKNLPWAAKFQEKRLAASTEKAVEGSFTVTQDSNKAE